MEQDAAVSAGITDFGIALDFVAGESEVAVVFDVLHEVIRSFERLNTYIVQSVTPGARVTARIVAFEVGSVWTWVADRLEDVDDDALKELDWKKMLGTVLVKVKKKIVRWLRKNSRVESAEQIRQLAAELDRVVENTDVKRISVYGRIEPLALLNMLIDLVEQIRRLKREKIYLVDKRRRKRVISKELDVNPAVIEELAALPSRQIRRLRLLIKKPDLLGRSKWSFKSEIGAIEAHVQDAGWSERLRTGQIRLRSGDCLVADVASEPDKADPQRMVHDVVKVHEVESAHILGQKNLFG